MSTDQNMLQEPEVAVPSLADVQTAIRVLFEPDQVVELRGLGLGGGDTPKKFTKFGFYNDHNRLAEDALKLSDTPAIFGTYFTLQPIKPELFLRSPNKFRTAGKNECTADADVVSYRWLPLDFDPVRSAGISSTGAEKAAALAVMLRTVSFLDSLGIHSLQADSANGYHALCRLDLQIDDKTLVQRVLAMIADRFATDAVHIDQTVYNPARIWKVYGTVGRKGHSSVERPHRAARLMTVPETLEIVSRELLETLAEEIPAEPDKKSTRHKTTKDELKRMIAKLEQFMTEAHINRGAPEEYKDGYKWILERCVFNSEHTGGCAIVTLFDTGFGYRCHHDSCFGKKWIHFREYCEAVIGHKFEFKEQATEAEINPAAIVCRPGLLTEMVCQTEQVLHGMGLKYFERHNKLVNVCYGREGEVLEDVERDGESVIIQSASAPSILRDLDQRAVYVKRVNSKLGPVDIRLKVPETMPDQLHDRVRSQPRSVPYESLMMVTGSPVLLPSGKVHDYATNFEEGVLYVNAHTDYYAAVPENPTKEMALGALAQFDPVFSMFPFIDPDNDTKEPRLTASYAVALSGTLSLIARPYMAAGPIPIHGVTAHTPRSGKTKICESACTAALGHRPTAIHYSGEEELDKHLLPLMVAGDRSILIDNVEKSLESSKLCILVTTGSMYDRVLGKSETMLLKNYAVLWTTGNNLIIGGDLSARAIRCDINPNVEFPESRTFDFDPVLRAQELHPTLVVAGLTMLRAYIVAGMPWTLKRPAWGGFVRWDKLICGCLTWLGMADPFLTRARIMNDDPVRAAGLDILEVWFQEYGERTVTFRKIQKDRGEVYNILLKGTEWNGYFARWLLSRLLGKTVGGLTLVRAAGKSEYKVTQSPRPRVVPGESEEVPQESIPF